MDSFQYILPVGEFRSQGEKFFAEWLDSWSIPWVYEPECLRLPKGELYRPDFVLPISQVMVEIKPIVFAHELSKAYQAAEILPSGWHFWIVEMRGREPWAIDVCQIGDNYRGWGTNRACWGVEGNGFVTCLYCLRPYILSELSYKCHHCAYYDGDGGFDLYPKTIMNPPEKLLDLSSCRRRVNHFEENPTRA